MNEKQLLNLEQFGTLHRDVSLTTLTTIRVGGIVDAVLYPHNLISLIGAVKYCQEQAIQTFIFGNGSNILATDEPFHGLIIKLTRTLNHSYIVDNHYMVEAGYSLPSLAHNAAKHSHTGLEWASGIPGSLGGAIYMNAGAYLRSMADIVEDVLVLIDGKCQWLNKGQCKFEYRKSIFQENPSWTILAATFSLEKGNPQDIQELMTSRQKRRFETQPLNQYSFGSCFRNPQKPSWQYIKEAGLTGLKIGGAQVSQLHSNFIVNVDHASFEDIKNIIEVIQDTVYKQFKVDLILEVEPFNWNKTTKHL